MVRIKKKQKWSEVLKHPLLISLVSILLGSGLFNMLQQQINRNDARNQIAVDFLNETGTKFNGTLSRLFGTIRSKDIVDSDIADLNNDVGELYGLRFSIRIKSKSFLKDDTFAKDFDKWTFEMDDLIDHLDRFTYQEVDTARELRHIHGQKIDLIRYWKLDIDTTKSKDVFDEMESLAHVFWVKGETMIIERLEKLE